MYTYNLFQWMMFFFVYCFFGWCIESAIVSISKRKLVNRGFLRIPMLPLYGFGAVLILFLTIPFKDSPWLVYIAGAIGATVLEYFTGWAMESLFKMKYWDYSNQRLQFQGRICVSSSLFWGVLSVALTEYIHPPIELWILRIPNAVLISAVCVTACIMLADTVISAKAALDLAKVLEQLSAAREEIDRLRSQLDELKEAAQLQFEELKESTQLQLEDLKESAQLQLEELREGKETIQSQLKERAEQLKARVSQLSEERESEIRHLGFFKSQLLKGHPSAYSKRFNTTLREIRDRLDRKQK